VNWRLQIAVEVENDILEAIVWYESRQEGLGVQFCEEIIQVWNALTENPLLNSRRHPMRNIRWSYPKSFPYRVIYEVDETTYVVRIAAVLHAARHERHWHKRL
jgi:toxin ParE1/3/4